MSDHLGSPLFGTAQETLVSGESVRQLSCTDSGTIPNVANFFIMDAVGVKMSFVFVIEKKSV